MDKNIENQEMVELVLKSLLFEVFKDGQFEQSEKDLINKLGSALQVSRERFAEIIEQFPAKSHDLSSSIERSPAGYVEVFVSVRAKLVEHYPAEKQINTLKNWLYVSADNPNFQNRCLLDFNS